MTDAGLLRRAAERAAQRPFYLASSLLAYARAERLDDDALAAQAGCDLASLPLLLLCRRPSGGGAVFRADVEAIAARFALDAVRLARLIRRADAVAGLGRTTLDRSQGLLAAARDRVPDREPDPDPALAPAPALAPDAPDRADPGDAPSPGSPPDGGAA
ncbi:MAG: hypothetical protein U0893_10395 [Chloroflexota bacterium]